MRRSPKQGFTLLELSIVLVIIGLLIGGIFVGQSLIHTAQLNAVVSEFNKYQTSVQNFKQQYQALPGDMSNASSFWGPADGSTGNTAGCLTTASTTSATCNGDGNGIITYVTGSYEFLRFWQHLANAKMIEGQYSGAEAGGGGTSAVPGTNIPTSKYPNGAWSVWTSMLAQGGNYTLCGTNTVQLYGADYGTGHILIFGAPWSTCVTASQPIITPKDAWSLDKKVDDGKPGTGNIIGNMYNGGFGSATACGSAANTNDLTGTYNLNNSVISCTLFFIAGF
jgi:prepilin-type N-terminal cleavage/methylation domain-containing protein